MEEKEETRDEAVVISGSTKEGNVKKAVASLLPEIIADIMSRLPIEDILRYKIVSKGWNAMTKDPHFIEMHFKRALCLPHRIILDPTVVGAISSLCLIGRENGMWRGRHIPVENLREDYMGTVATCHGFLCVASSKSEVDPLFIYNPITRESVALPKTYSKLGECNCTIGFGYDSTSKKYKVVRFFKFYNDGIPQADMKCEIITLGDGSWREVEASYGVVCNPYSEPLFLDGALHWLIDGVSHSSRDRILVFDLGDEKFRTIKFPSSLIGSIKSPPEKMFLLNLEGSLSLVEHVYCEPLRVWKIVPCDTNKGYRFFQSSHVMPPTTFNNLILSPKLKCKLMHNTFLFHVRIMNLVWNETKDHFALFSPGQQEHQYVEVPGIPEIFQPNLFVPCLFSPQAAFGNRDQ